MSKKIKAIVVVGGTGGHVFPGLNLAKHLLEENYDIDLITDKRGLKFIQNFENLNIFVLPSSPLVSKNIFSLIFSSILIIYSVLVSFFFLLFKRPKIIFGMGGYASFPTCVAASILKIKFIIYENNLIIGKANKLLLPYAKKIFVSYKELNGISNKYKEKILEIGNIIKKEIINFKALNSANFQRSKINLLVLGGSQAAKIFAEVLPNIFKECSNQNINLKIYQHCLPSQNEKLKLFYEQNNIEFEIFNFSNKLEEYFSKVELAITRSGSSILAELTNAKIPFISVPLPSSADNHQLINATFYQRKNYALLVEEKDLKNKLLPIIQEIYSDKSFLDRILYNQRQYSDKNVYNNINNFLKKIINEKN